MNIVQEPETKEKSEFHGGSFVQTPVDNSKSWAILLST